LILGLIYKNLSCDISFFLDELELVLDKINNENKNKFMMGDFNMDLLNRANSSDFVNMMVSHDSFPLVTIPTRILHLLASLIDNFLLMVDCLKDTKQMWLCQTARITFF
jgi:hypothetical protein